MWREEFINLLKDNRIDRAYSLKAQNIPTALFRYRSFTERELENLYDDLIYLADPSKFHDANDINDSLISFDAEKLKDSLIKSNFDDFISKHQLNKFFSPTELSLIKNFKDSYAKLIELFNQKFPLQKDLLEALNFVLNKITNELNPKYLDQLTRKVTDSYRIGCFSEDPFSNLMWIHYAQTNKGFMIEYNFNELLSNDHRQRFIYPIKYISEPFDCTPFLLPGQFTPLYTLFATLHKNIKWGYENEWRLVFSNGILTENYVKMPRPKAIYLGMNISDSHKDLLLEYTRSKEIPCYSIEKHLKNREYILRQIRIY